MAEGIHNCAATPSAYLQAYSDCAPPTYNIYVCAITTTYKYNI